MDKRTHEEKTPEEKAQHRKTQDIDPVADLIRLAGPGDPVPEDAVLRARQAVQGAWRETVQQRRRKTRAAWAAAASLLLVVSVLTLSGSAMDWLFGPRPTVAVLESVTGTGLRPSPGSTTPLESSKPAVIGDILRAGDTVATTDGRAALRLSGGASLRLDAHTRLTWVAAQELRLESGAVYADSGPRDAQITIHTPLGTVRDIGTQFEARLEGADLRIRVREGEVEVLKGRRRSVAKRGIEMTVESDGEVRRDAVEVHGEPWYPYQSVAPSFELEGATLADYFRWLIRETGWTLDFSDPAIAIEAKSVVLHGSVHGVPVEETPLVVLPTCRLVGVPSDGIFEIRRMHEETF